MSTAIRIDLKCPLMKRFTAMLLAALMALACASAVAEIAQWAAPDALPDQYATANDIGMYRVIVRDTDDNPVEGAIIQLCDDLTCAFQPTDSDGVAAFDVAEQKVYDVRVLVAPDGYVPDGEEYLTLAVFCDVAIVLVKAPEMSDKQ